jgi:hypothetical protein
MYERFWQSMVFFEALPRSAEGADIAFHLGSSTMVVSPKWSDIYDLRFVVLFLLNPHPAIPFSN